MSRKLKNMDTDVIVKKFGGKHQIVADFEKILRTVISAKAVEKWIERKSIPAHQLLNLKTIANKRGIEFVIDEYLK